MRTNTAKARLKAGEAIYGCFVRYPDPGLVEFMGYQPWDFLVFDGEHGVLEPRDCENMVRAADVRGMTPMVRVPTNQPATILRLMDTGAQGLIVPWVNSAAEAEAAVRSVKYHPRGQRGLAGVRAADYGQAGTLGDYTQQANAETMVVVQVETAAAVEQAGAIAAVDGVDVVFIGPSDLSQSYGVPGQPQHPTVQAAMDQIIQAVSKTSAAVGIMVPNAAAARQWRERGARYIAIGLEAVLAPAAREYLKTVREA
jgi:2-keto-3-deoxy-L-rhamnonate aldolase RhmA